MYLHKRLVRTWTAFPAIVLIVAITVIAGPAAIAAYTTQVPLGAARSFAVLAAAAVTANAGTTINGSLGWGTAYSPPAGTLNGTSTGPLANWQPEQAAMTAAYNDIVSRPGTSIAAELGGTTLVTVTDDTLPTISAPADASYLFESDVPAADTNDATAADNCGVPTVTVCQ